MKEYVSTTSRTDVSMAELAKNAFGSILISALALQNLVSARKNPVSTFIRNFADTQRKRKHVIMSPNVDFIISKIADKRKKSRMIKRKRRRWKK